MADQFFVGVMMGRIEMWESSCCGAVFRDRKEADEHENWHLNVNIRLKLLEEFALNI